MPTDDLTCGYDLAGGATTAATAWYRPGTQLMTLFLPMEGGASNALLDFSGSPGVVQKKNQRASIGDMFTHPWLRTLPYPSCQ